jgi:hypothetical protein
MTANEKEIFLILIAALFGGFLSLIGKYMRAMITGKGGEVKESRKEFCSLHSSIVKGADKLEDTDKTLFRCFGDVEHRIQSVEVTSAQHGVILVSLKERQDNFDKTIASLKTETRDIKSGQEKIQGHQLSLENSVKNGFIEIMNKLK